MKNRGLMTGVAVIAVSIVAVCVFMRLTNAWGAMCTEDNAKVCLVELEK